MRSSSTEIDHGRLTKLPAPDAEAMLQSGRRELEAAIGRTVRWYRPPYGALTAPHWRVVRRAGMSPVLWTTSALDGRDASDDERMRHATARMANGSILLAHDSRAGAADGVDDPPIAPIDRTALLARILEAYAQRGLRAVSLEDAASAGRLKQAMVLRR